MGSRSNIHLAYIAGFLDGDGSLMLQLKKRKDGNRKWRLMATICFYQDTRHEKPLVWIRKTLKIGYLSQRRDGISELRINGFEKVGSILKELMPFIKFKSKQAKALYHACKLLVRNKKLSNKDISKLIDIMLLIQQENYVTRKKKTRKEFLKIFGLTP